MEEIQTFKSSFQSRNSLADKFEKNIQILKSLGSFSNSESSEKEQKANSHAFIPSREYNLKITANSDHIQHQLSQKYSIMLESEVMAVRYNNSATILACGLNNGTVVLIDNDKASVIKSFLTSFEKYPVTSLRWKPNTQNSQILTISSSEGHLMCYNATLDKVLYKTQIKQQSQILCSDYNQDSKILAYGMNTGKIGIWNDIMQKDERMLDSSNWFNNGHSNRIFSIKFIPDDQNMLLSAGWEKAIFLWDIRDPKVRSSASSCNGCTSYFWRYT